MITAAQIHALGPHLYANDRPGPGVTVNACRVKLVGTISEPGPNRPEYFRPDGSQFPW